jgi:hypothetical protein
MYWTNSIINTNYSDCDLKLCERHMMTIDDKCENYNNSDDDGNNNSINHVTETQSQTQEETLEEKCKKRLNYVQKCQDPLFWTLFLAKYGIHEYNRTKNNGNIEMKEKSEMSSHFHTTGSSKLNNCLQTKITKSGCGNMASQILTEPRMNWDSLYLVCAYYECNIYIVDLEKKTYVTYLRQNSGLYPTYVLYRTRKSNPIYYLDTNEQLYGLEYIANHFVHIMSYEKPFKGVSNYKVSELESFAIKMNIKYEPKTKKNDLYGLLALRASEASTL